MPTDDGYRRKLEERKLASFGQVLIKTARLFNEAAIARFRTDPNYEWIRQRHLSAMPHLDLEGTRVTELARRMEITKQGVGQLVDELAERGFVERIPDPDDGRAKLVRFTDGGRNSMLDGLAVLEAIEAEVAEAIGRSELTRLHGALIKVLRVLEPSEDDLQE